MKKFLGIIFALFLLITAVSAQEVEVLPSESALVQKVEYYDEEDNTVVSVRQIVTVKLIGGENAGKVIQVENALSGNPYYDINLKKRMRVLLHVEKLGDEVVFSIADIERSSVLFWLACLFAGLLIYVGGKKGIYSLVSIVLTCALLCKALSPMILAGINPIFSTMLICLFSTAITMYLVGGFNRKSSSAILGCVTSLILAVILSALVVKIASLTGFSSEHSMFLYSMHPELNFVALIISTMIIATMGAVMDVAMSIASTINEIHAVDSTKTVKELFNSGMNVGRDVIGTMANTLILVYLGASLPLLLLASNIDFQKFINLNQVVTEVASALIGSCAIVICVPITALIAAQLISKKSFNLTFFINED